MSEACCNLVARSIIKFLYGFIFFKIFIFIIHQNFGSSSDKPYKRKVLSGQMDERGMTITSTDATVLVAHSLSSFYALKNLRNNKKTQMKIEGKFSA